MWRTAYNIVKATCGRVFRESGLSSDEEWTRIGTLIYAIDENLFAEFKGLAVKRDSLTTDLEGYDALLTARWSENMGGIMVWAVDTFFEMIQWENLSEKRFVIYFGDAYAGEYFKDLLVLIFYKNIAYGNILDLSSLDDLVDTLLSSSSINGADSKDLFGLFVALAAELNDLETVKHYYQCLEFIFECRDWRTLNAPVASAVINNNLDMLSFFRSKTKSCSWYQMQDTRSSLGQQFSVINRTDGTAKNMTLIEMATESGDEAILAFVQEWIDEPKPKPKPKPKPVNQSDAASSQAAFWASFTFKEKL